MQTILIALSLILGLDAASKPVEDPNAPCLVPTYKRMLVLGDDQVEGLGPALSEIAGQKDIDFVFEARRGSTARAWNVNSAFGASVGEFDPDIVIVVLGTNEALGAVDAVSLTAEFQRLVDRLTPDAGYRKIILVTPPRLTKPKNLKKVVGAISNVAGAIWLDFSEKDYPLRDGIRLRPDAYPLWAADLAKDIGL